MKKGRYDRIKRNGMGILLLLAFSVFFAGCGKIKEEKHPGKNLTELTVVLDWTPNTEHSGLYMALKKGYFEEEGLDVTVVEPPEDGAVSMVAAGESEFGIGYQDELAENFASDAQLPVAAVAALLQHNQIGFISQTLYGIDRPGKIPDHVVAVSDDVIEQTMVRTLIEQEGGDFSRVTMEETYVDDVVKTMHSGPQVVLGRYGWDGIACERAGKIGRAHV